MLSIVIPAYNEEKRLPYTLASLREGFSYYRKDCEIIIVDDGSTDKTCEVAKNEVLVKLPHNMGKGAAIAEGLKCAKGDIVVILDADMPTVVEEIISLSELLKKYDIAIGSRRMPNSFVCRSKYKNFTSCVFGHLARALTGLPYQDTQCGVKVLRKSAVDKILPLLTEKGFLIDIDLLFAADATRCNVKEEGILWVDRIGSKVHLFRDSIKMAVGLVSLRKKYRKVNRDHRLEPAMSRY